MHNSIVYQWLCILANLKIKLSQSDPCVNNNNNNLKYTFFTNCRPGLEQNFCQIFFSNLVIHASQYVYYLCKLVQFQLKLHGDSEPTITTTKYTEQVWAKYLAEISRSNFYNLEKSQILHFVDVIVRVPSPSCNFNKNCTNL